MPMVFRLMNLGKGNHDNAGIGGVWNAESEEKRKICKHLYGSNNDMLPPK